MSLVRSFRPPYPIDLAEFRHWWGPRTTAASDSGHLEPATFGWVATELDQDLAGTIGWVTVPILVGHPGEVVLPVRGGTEAFAAWSDEPIAKHARVVVVECRSARSVTVTPFG